MDDDYIANLSELEFAQLWAKVAPKILEDPIQNFVKAQGFIDLKTVTPAQVVALKLVFNQTLDPTTQHGIFSEIKDDQGKFDLETVQMTETELFAYMTGRDYDEFIADRDEDTKLNTINLIIGRRGGKTLIASILAILSAVKMNWKPYLQKTPFATVLIMSHDSSFSEETLEQIRTLIEDSPILRRCINHAKKNTQKTMNLRTPWLVDPKKPEKITYSRVQIKVAPARAKSPRGAAICGALCDEIAFWNLEENLKDTDEDILKALRPATAQFGDLATLIKLSSPGIKQGVLYNEYLRWQEKSLPDNYVVLKAPSWVWNTILPKKAYQEEQQLNDDSFDTEFRANFTDSLSNWIQGHYIELCVDKGVIEIPSESGVNYRAAIDAGFKQDSFTFSIVGKKDNRVKQYVSIGWAASKLNPVDSIDVAKSISKFCKLYKINRVVADQYSFQPLRSIFAMYDMVLEERTFTNTLKHKIYWNLRKLIHDESIDLLDNPKQTKELKELVVERTGSNTIKIGHPSLGSDDYADSLAMATYLVVEEINNGEFNFDSHASGQKYGIQIDTEGRSFQAPSPEILSMSGHFGAEVMDNTSSYTLDPDTGKLVHCDVLESDEGDGMHFLF